MNSNDIRGLTPEEISVVGGAGILRDNWNDAREILRELPNAYRDAINSLTDMMCTATGKC